MLIAEIICGTDNFDYLWWPVALDQHRRYVGPPLTGTIRYNTFIMNFMQILWFIAVITNSLTFPFILNPLSPPPKPGPPVFIPYTHHFIYEFGANRSLLFFSIFLKIVSVSPNFTVGQVASHFWFQFHVKQYDMRMQRCFIDPLAFLLHPISDCQVKNWEPVSH